MPDLKKTVGMNIRQARTARGKSQTELADECDISLDMVGRIERGKAAPSFDTLEKISKVLRTPVGTFFGERPELPSFNDGRQKNLAQIWGHLSSLSARDIEWIERVLKAILRK